MGGAQQQRDFVNLLQQTFGRQSRRDRLMTEAYVCEQLARQWSGHHESDTLTITPPRHIQTQTVTKRD